MTNMRLIVDNRHDSAQLIASSAALPVAYTQQSGRTRVWRSIDSADQTITAALPGSMFLEAVVIYRHNLSSAARVRLELLSAGAVVYDSGRVNISGMIPLGQFRFGVDPWGATSTDDIPTQQAPFWFPPTLCDGYRLTLIDPDNADGYLQVDRIVAGSVLTPRYNPSFGLQLTWEEAAEHRVTEGLSLRTVGGGIPRRRLPIDLAHIDPRDREAFTNAFLRTGKGRDLYVSVFPERGGVDEAEYAFLARRETNYSHTHDRARNWRMPITLIEV